MGLAQIYETQLRDHGMRSAQVLLTHADLADRERYLNARSTLVTLLGLKVVPVINENDTVVNDEIKFGDNDTLGALVANLVEADALVILTDQRGLYAADPRKEPGARFIDEARAGAPELELMAGGAGSSLGRGGMLTKILAAKRAAAQRRLDGDCLGARARCAAAPGGGRGHRHARCSRRRRSSRRASSGWPTTCSCAARCSSTTARSAKLRDEGKSLLPIGMIEVHGEFAARRRDRGARAWPGAELARGLANYAQLRGAADRTQAVDASSSAARLHRRAAR